MKYYNRNYTPVTWAKPNTPGIEVGDKVYKKIMHWMEKAAPNECSGFGEIVWDAERNVFIVKDAWLAEQKNTTGTTELDAESLLKLDAEHDKAIAAGTREGKLRWWWHSHVNMGVFWSGTDLEAIAQLGEHGWFTATVFNLKGETKSAAYQNKPFSMYHEDIPTTIAQSVNARKLQLDISSIVEAANEIDFTISKDMQTKAEEALAKLFTDSRVAPTKAELKQWDKEFKANVPKQKPYNSWIDDKIPHSIGWLDSIEDIVIDLEYLLWSNPNITWETVKDRYKEKISVKKLKQAIFSDKYLKQHFFPRTVRKVANGGTTK